MRSRTNTISAANTWADAITIKRGGVLTLSGTFSAIVTLQRKPVGGSWGAVSNNSGNPTTFTTAGTYTIEPLAVPADYRWGVATDDYTSGSVVGTIEGR